MWNTRKWLLSFLSHKRRNKETPTDNSTINESSGIPSTPSRFWKRSSGKGSRKTTSEVAVSPVKPTVPIKGSKYSPIPISLLRKTIHEEAASRIQTAFRCYLARKALRALKALVRIQALVRGYLVRKQTTVALRKMHVLIAVQNRARRLRSHPLSESTTVSRIQSSCRRSPSRARAKLHNEMDIRKIWQRNQLQGDESGKLRRLRMVHTEDRRNVYEQVPGRASFSYSRPDCMYQLAPASPSLVAFARSSKARERMLEEVKQRRCMTPTRSPFSYIDDVMAECNPWNERGDPWVTKIHQSKMEFSPSSRRSLSSARFRDTRFTSEVKF